MKNPLQPNTSAYVEQSLEVRPLQRAANFRTAVCKLHGRAAGVIAQHQQHAQCGLVEITDFAHVDVEPGRFGARSLVSLPKWQLRTEIETARQNDIEFAAIGCES